MYSITELYTIIINSSKYIFDDFLYYETEYEINGF